MRLLDPQMRFVEEHAHMFPDLVGQLTNILHHGVLAQYGGGAPLNPRKRGLPYRANDEENSQFTQSKMWTDIYNRRMFLRTTNTVQDSDYIEATPTTTVEKKNTDRSISADRRVISDMRRINLHFESCQYYQIVVPKIQDIARRIMSLRGSYPNLPIQAASRDIESAFRLLRLRPAMVWLMVAEFPAAHCNLDGDILCCYLVMPFGWNGSPSHFALFGDAITLAHQQHGITRKGFLDHAFTSRMYVGDGIFVELSCPVLLDQAIQCWERLARGILGSSAIDGEKLQEEGPWKSAQIILGFVIDLDTLTITCQNKRWQRQGFFLRNCCPTGGRNF